MNKIHTVTQPSSDVTVFVLSCDRLDVLDKTLKSFFATNSYPVKMVILDDSGKEGIFETLVDRYGAFSDVLCFSENRGQWWAIDFMTSYCSTDYIFYLEDDWQFTGLTGYIEESKRILESNRVVGNIDISWRTFKEDGADHYIDELIEDSYYYKKPMQITPWHFSWEGWCGSPNLKRREDLLMLGRVEFGYNEWNIDKKFHSLGLCSIFLKDRYVEHIGWDCSKMAGKRPNDRTVPYDYIPKEVLARRTYPQYNYYSWMNRDNFEFQGDYHLVTAFIDLDREDRGFDHYLNSIKRILDTNYPLTVFCPEKFFDFINENSRHGNVNLIPLNEEDIYGHPYYDRIKNIVTKEEWINQADWIKDSVLTKPEYILLTLLKQELLEKASISKPNAKYHYWIDAGIYNSFHLNDYLDSYYFTRVDKSALFMTSFPYEEYEEIHGYAKQKYKELFNIQPNKVCRATFFGGTREQIASVGKIYQEVLFKSLRNYAIGTEESIYTICSMLHPELFTIFEMEYGDIRLFLGTTQQKYTLTQ